MRDALLRPSWSSAASAPRAPGRGRACSPRPCSSATTRQTFTPPPSAGNTSRPAWPCSSPANLSSARRGSGSPGWASVSGSGPAFPRGRFRLRRTARGSSSGRSITRSEPSRARPRMADNSRARTFYRRGDVRRDRVRQDLHLSAPVRAPDLELARGQSRAATGRARPGSQRRFVSRHPPDTDAPICQDKRLGCLRDVSAHAEASRQRGLRDAPLQIVPQQHPRLPSVHVPPAPSLLDSPTSWNAGQSPPTTKVCSFRLPQMCGFRVPLTPATYLHAYRDPNPLR